MSLSSTVPFAALPRLQPRAPRLVDISRALTLALLAGCASDPCASLCAELARELDTCHDVWGTTWEDLSAPSRAAWRADCQDDWAIVRADMEPRQVSAAEDACATTSDSLSEPSCEALRGVYLLRD